MPSLPKITVIIPTRERCDVLEKSLRTATMQDYDNLEILVSDNFSNDETLNVVKRANDKRIKYVNTGKRISMSHNWEFALSTVKEGWVTFMGDDDGLLPEAISSVAEIIKSTDIKSIRSTFCAYDWPMTAQNRHGQLIVPMRSGLSIRDSRKWISKVLSGKQKYTQLPMIYNGGFTHISILNNVREKTGSYFLSAAPDVYSSIAIASTTHQYIYSLTPFSISGTSAHSTGNSYYSNSTRRNKSSALKFSTENNLPFHTDLPLQKDGSYPLSLHALVYEAYLQSRMLRPESDHEDRARQLRIIMGTATESHRKSISDWGKLFADMHGIDYGATKRRAILTRTCLQSYSLTQKLINSLNSVITESLPIKDIFEASIAASIIRSSNGRLDTLRFLAKRAVGINN